jgi:hypothetical protein
MASGYRLGRAGQQLQRDAGQRTADLRGGRLRTRSYDKDGEKRYVTEIVAQRVQFLGPKPNGGVTDID